MKPLHRKRMGPVTAARHRQRCPKHCTSPKLRREQNPAEIPCSGYPHVPRRSTAPPRQRCSRSPEGERGTDLRERRGFPWSGRDGRRVRLHPETAGAAPAPHLLLGVIKELNSQTSGGRRKGRENSGRGMGWDSPTSLPACTAWPLGAAK